MSEVNEMDLLKWLQIMRRYYIKKLDQKLISHHLNSSLYYYIVKLFEFGDLPQEKIVQLTGVNPSNVTRAIKKLIELNFICKKENPNDRRGFLLSLTKAGEKMYPTIMESIEEVNNEFLSSLSQKERKYFIESINKLANK
ncbi:MULTISPECIES: MarR family winged helix-turn-helix transcriptional regulator [Bacillus subtilis group]|uniref:MarR family winged helix-turn-helix transcriptional regulator n=2 Tax=Bacillaceae TaxID=186817 RepID=UPI000B21DD26|nr:MarR family transcriptional regulator [Bacillus atrophaeus]MCY8856547.1 MarR family transcriptional regulator [Bacillus atrophaeus]MED1123282.1 MarR family transcriptional regulator [Bacillus atrophaeus]